MYTHILCIHIYNSFYFSVSISLLSVRTSVSLTILSIIGTLLLDCSVQI